MAARKPHVKLTSWPIPDDPVLCYEAEAALVRTLKHILVAKSYKVIMALAIACLLGRSALPRVFVTSCQQADLAAL